MILPDVNVLVYAFRDDAEQHEPYARWIQETVAGAEAIAISDAVLSGFVRVVTHPRLVDPPAPTSRALEFVDWLIAAPGAHWVAPGAAVWATFATLAEDRGIRGNLVPDAYLAALCIAHGARLATADRGFARFERLRFFDPAR